MKTWTMKRKFFLYICGCASLLLIALLWFSDSNSISAIAADKRVVTSGLDAYDQYGYKTYQLFVTPDNPSIIALANQLDDRYSIYQAAVQWIYVSEQRLNGTNDMWQYPSEFLKSSPYLPTNPLPGSIVGDCEEQANTLVSLLRASGVPAEEVRVVLGDVSEDDDFVRGHVWVELFEKNEWLAIDPSQGLLWNDRYERLVEGKGLPFDYYSQHEYPVTEISLYYNDSYYIDIRTGVGNAPESWY